MSGDNAVGSWREERRVVAGAQPAGHRLKGFYTGCAILRWLRYGGTRGDGELHLISPSEFSNLYRRVRGHTVCSVARLRGLHEGVKYVVGKHVEATWWNRMCAWRQRRADGVEPAAEWRAAHAVAV